MRQCKIFIFAFVTLVMMASSAFATEFMDMDIEIGRKVVANALCKSPDEVNYVTMVRDNLYLYSAFYAKKESHFFVGVYTDFIRLQGKEFKTITKTIPYKFDEATKCAIVKFSVPDCPTDANIIACSEKTIEEKKSDEFWDKSIPELLEEDLEQAIKAGQEPAAQENQDDTEGQPEAEQQ